MKNKKLLEIIVLAILAFVVSGCESKYQDIEKKQMNGMHRETIKGLKKMIEKSPDSAKAHLLLANAYLNTGNLNLSEERFNSALTIGRREGREKQIEQSIGEKYKNAFFGFLESSKGDEQYAFERMSKVADNDTLALAKNDLKIFCNNYMNERDYHMAYNGYKYLAELNSSLNDEIGQKHLALFGKTKDGKIKTSIIDNAVKFSHEATVIKAHSRHHYELSKLSKNTEGAIVELKIANQIWNLYSSELQAKQDQLKQEKLQVKINELSQKKGKPDFDKVLTVNGKKHYIFKNPKVNDEFHYLSSGEFTGGDNGGKIKCITSPNSCRVIGYFSQSEINGSFYITKKDSNVRVVGWKK